MFDIKQSFMRSYRGCWQRLVPNQQEYQDVWHLWDFVSRFPAENSKAIISKTVIDPSTSFWLRPVSENPLTRLDRTPWNQQRCEVWKWLVENYRRHSDMVGGWRGGGGGKFLASPYKRLYSKRLCIAISSLSLDVSPLNLESYLTLKAFFQQWRWIFA